MVDWLIRRMPKGRRTIAMAAAVVVVGVIWWVSGKEARPTWERNVILDAIRMVESGGRANPPDGDGGLAIGPYQIHRVYWQDAVEAEPQLGGGYEDCRKRAYAERVIGAYMRRYVPAAWEAGDGEVIARTHNGGPDGAVSAGTLGYWGKVRARLP